jgi:ferredoxin
MCVLVNEAYEVLSDPVLRTEYNSQLDEALTDDEDGYTGQPLSKWCANNKNGKNTDANEERAVFVDEVTCIGCKQCVWAAPATFRIEDAHGRSRVFGQWLDTEENLQAAIDVCPVSCIHWVNRQDLPALEYVVQNCMGRTNVGLMMSGQGGFIDDVFQRTARFLRERVAREEARERAKKYSAAQETARRAAADAMAQQRGNTNDWLSQFADRIGVSLSSGEWPGSMSSFGGSMSSMDIDMDDEYSQYKRVGKRNKEENGGDGSGNRNGNGRSAVATNGNGSFASNGEDEGWYSDDGGSGSEGVPDDRALVQSRNGKARWQR